MKLFIFALSALIAVAAVSATEEEEFSSNFTQTFANFTGPKR